MKLLFFLFNLLIVSTIDGQIMEQNNPIGNPNEVVQVGDIVIPVYEFNGFSPLLEQKDGRTYVINFWATWCKPCVEEIPHFIKLADELKEQDVEFLFVSLDFRKNLEKSVINFVKDNGMQGRTVLLHDPDANSWIDRVDPSWTGAIPATLVMKSADKKFYEEKLSYDELKSVINSF